MKCPDCNHEMDMIVFTSRDKRNIISVEATCNHCGSKYSGTLKKVDETMGHTRGQRQWEWGVRCTLK